MNQPTRSSFKGIVDVFKSTPSSLFGNRQVHVHIGAHKTATSFIQDCLKENNSTLFKNGVLYLPLNEMRADQPISGKRLTNRFIELSHANRSLCNLPELRKEILNAIQPTRLDKCHTVLISEENLSLELSGYKSVNYSGIAQRLMHLRQEIGPKLKVFFSIRDYPDFLSSIYVEILRHHPYLSFGDFVSVLYDDMPNFWSEAYHSLAHLFGEENVVVWDFEDTIRNPKSVLSMLAAGGGGFQISNKPARSSLSQRAVEFIRDFSKLPGKPLPAPIICKVADRLHPLSKLNSKFDPWTPREKKYLRQHYMEEKKSIPLWSPAL